MFATAHTHFFARVSALFCWPAETCQSATGPNRPAQHRCPVCSRSHDHFNRQKAVMSGQSVWNHAVDLSYNDRADDADSYPEECDGGRNDEHLAINFFARQWAISSLQDGARTV